MNNILKKTKNIFLPITTKISQFNKRKNDFLCKVAIKRKELLQKRIAGKSQSVTIDNRKYICKNCKAEFTGKYCFNCGQEANTKRLSWGSVMNNIFGGITNIARGFGFTILELFTRPGYMINDFIHGKRVIYAKPFQMLFVLAAIYAVSAQLLYSPKPKTKENTEITKPVIKKDSQLAIKQDINKILRDSINKAVTSQVKEKSEITEDRDAMDDIVDAKEEIADALTKNLENQPFLQALFAMLYDWFSTNKALSAILFLPFITLGTKWAFRKSRHNPRFNFVETLFVCSYMSCQMLIISIIFLPFTNKEIWVDSMIKILISLWTLHELFRNRKRGTLGRYLLSYIYACGIITLLGVFILFLLWSMSFLIK